MNSLTRLVLDVAISEIGKGEKGKNNAGPDIEKYLNGIAEPPANWCAAFISYCFKTATDHLDIGMPFEYTLSARHMMNQIEFKGTGTIQKTDPEAGDLLFLWRGSKNSWMGHVGIIENVSEKFIHTIEGNRGSYPSKVRPEIYPINYIPCLLGYGRIYNKEDK